MRSTGTQSDLGNGVGAQNASLSADGRVVAFESSAFLLVPGDTNNLIDIFVRSR